MKRIFLIVSLSVALLPCVFAEGGGEQGTAASSGELIVIVTNHETASFRGPSIQTTAFAGGY
jgi:hypothetical protein